jgi:hypothetical protein
MTPNPSIERTSNGRARLRSCQRPRGRWLPLMSNVGPRNVQLHNIGLPLFMVGLGFLLTGTESVFLLVLVSAIAVIVGLVLFAANVLLNIKSASPAAETAHVTDI